MRTFCENGIPTPSDSLAESNLGGPSFSRNNHFFLFCDVPPSPWLLRPPAFGSGTSGPRTQQMQSTEPSIQDIILKCCPLGWKWTTPPPLMPFVCLVFTLLISLWTSHSEAGGGYLFLGVSKTLNTAVAIFSFQVLRFLFIPVVPEKNLRLLPENVTKNNITSFSSLHILRDTRAWFKEVPTKEGRDADLFFS